MNMRALCNKTQNSDVAHCMAISMPSGYTLVHFSMLNLQNMLQQIMLYSLVFISGTIFGSFLNLVSDRVTKGKTILKGRSKCDHCNKSLSPKNLIPLISYIIQKGKCDKCRKKLSWYYPLSEILTGATFVWVTYYSGILESIGYPTVLTFIYLSVSMSFFIVLFFIDYVIE